MIAVVLLYKSPGGGWPLKISELSVAGPLVGFDDKQGTHRLNSPQLGAFVDVVADPAFLSEDVEAFFGRPVSVHHLF